MSHFKYDKALVRRTTRRNPERELQNAKQDGFYSYTEFHLVPIQRINPEAVWNPGRINRIREALTSNTPLPPIHGHFDPSGRFHISDGIHRYNASVEAGFSHVPAFASVHVDAPQIQEPELPERPKLSVGDTVLLREPKQADTDEPWAVIEQILYSSSPLRGGVRRHHYALVGIRKHEAEFIGDYRDDQLDIPSKPMPHAIAALFNKYQMWPPEGGTSPARVASRWLNRQP